MGSSAPLNFDQSQQQVEGMMERGMAFAKCRGRDPHGSASAPHKAALWLLAWSLRDHVQQRQDARLMVAAFAVGGQAGRRCKRNSGKT